MKYIDLHVHSNASDGTDTPAEVVKKAASMGLAAFALTDHDTVSGITKAIAAAKELRNQGKVIQVIPGIELSVSYKGKDIHILGLYIDYKRQTLLDSLKKIKKERDQRNEKMVENLAKDGINISIDKLRQQDKDAVLTRAHFAKYLVKIGLVKNNQEAFQKYLSSNGPYYVPRKYLSPKEGIELIKMAGGIPVLAHPLMYHFSDEKLEALLHDLKEDGLVGIETFYSMNTGFDEAYVKQLANKYDLLMTGGSDYHGTVKPLIELGIGKGNLKIPYSLLEKLEKIR